VGEPAPEELTRFPADSRFEPERQRLADLTPRIRAAGLSRMRVSGLATCSDPGTCDSG
jgi:hypothetical protein